MRTIKRLLAWIIRAAEMPSEYPRGESVPDYVKILQAIAEDSKL